MTKPRTMKEWAAWYEEFRKRHNLTPERVAELTGTPSVVNAPSKPETKPHWSESDAKEET